MQKRKQKIKSKGNKVLSFAEKVRNVVRAIPLGKTMTYKEVAKKSGNENASRAVGTIMANNFDKGVPCHRVIKSDGQIGNYNRGGTEAKTKLLENEKRLATKNIK